VEDGAAALADGGAAADCQWSIAAALMLTAGFGAGGCFTASADRRQFGLAEKGNSGRTPTTATAQLTDSRRRRRKRVADNKVIFTAIAKVEADRWRIPRRCTRTGNGGGADGAGLNQAQQQIVTLANYSQPDGNAPAH